MLLCAVPNVFAQQHNYDVTYYGLDVSFNSHEKSISGQLQFQARSLSDDLNEIELDLHPSMNVDSVTAAAVSFKHIDDKLIIKLYRDYTIDQMINFSVFYTGTPENPESVDSPLGFYRTGKNYVIRTESSPYYAHTWWPCKDNPADKADSADVRVTVDQQLIAASNGKLVNIDENDDQTVTYHWKITHPIATYLLTISISDYNVVSDYYVNSACDSLKLQYYLFRNRDEKQIIPFDTIKNMIQILEKYYGPYPFYEEKYGMTEYITRWAAMEYQTLSCFSSYAIEDEETILHELSHQWWGDCVSPANFHHTWISEGLAVYSEALYWGEVNGEQYYHKHFKDLFAAYDENDVLYRRTLDKPKEIYPLIIYHKGAWIFHTLRHVVGDSVFWEGLREFRNRYEYSAATTEDLQQVFEAVAHQSLDWFFAQWIYKPSFPEYNYGWTQKKISRGYKITAFLDRIKTDFIMPIDVAFYTDSSVISDVIWVKDSTTVFEFTSPCPVKKFVPDPGNWVLAKFHYKQAADIQLNEYRFEMDDEKIRYARPRIAN